MYVRNLLFVLGTLTAFGPAVADTLPAVSAAGITMAPTIVTGNSPSHHDVTPPGSMDGVAMLTLTYSGVSGEFGCSGSLLSGGSYILTAAHCLTGPEGQALTGAQVTFNLAGGPLTVAGANAYTPPTWDGNYRDGSDIGLLQLSSSVAIAGYDLARTEVSGTVDIAGYGETGFGLLGSTPGSFGALHTGQNTYDLLWTDDLGNNSWYGYDFDSGLWWNDAFGTEFGIHDLGLGNNREANIAPGDSGGPSFADGAIAGVHVWDATFGWPTDINGKLDSSWGEVAADTRVDLYASWIDSIVTGPTPLPVSPVPEPGAMVLLATVIAGFFAIRVAKRRGPAR